MGRDGDQVLRLRQRRPPGSLHHRHALGHVRESRRPIARSRRRAVHPPMAASWRRGETSSSSATRSSTTPAAGSSRRSPTALGVENYWPWGPSVGDVNADGWDDIFIASSMNYPHRYGINSLLLNDRGEKFLDAEFVLGIEPRRGGRTHTPWFELDCLQEGPGRADLCRGQRGQDHRDGAARQPLRGDLRSRRRRRSRHRDQRLQFSAAGARQRPGAAAADSLDPGGADRVRRRIATGSAPPCACTPAAASARSTTTASRDTCRRARCRCTSGSATPNGSSASRSTGRRDENRSRRSSWT